jgi:hypothetical protein
MEYAEPLAAQQSKRMLVASLVSLVIGAAVASGVWALADDDRNAAAGGASGPPAAAEKPGSLYGSSQYRPTYPPQPIPPAGGPSGPDYRYPHP